MRCEIRLSGRGGQGLITAGVILSEAAMRAGLEVAMSQSYGPEARGGASKAEVIVGDEPILYPKVQRPGIVLLMSQEAYEMYGQELEPGGVMIVDSSEVKSCQPQVEGRLIKLPITHEARTKLRPVVANVVALGVIAAATGLIDKEMMREAVLKRVPQGTEEMNSKAFELGYEMGKAA